MITRGAVNHLVLGVRDLARSRDWWCGVLAPLGFTLVQDEAELALFRNRAALLELGLQPAAHDDGSAFDRRRVGFHHLAFWAESREAVDAYHRDVLLARGVQVLDAPAEYPQYNGGRGYYAVFFADPDGLKLELAHEPEASK